MTFKVALELYLVLPMSDGGSIVVCVQMDDFLAAVIAEGGVEEEGAVDSLVSCCIDGGEICGSLEECG